MKTSMKAQIVIIGSGNVGTHLARVLYSKGHNILQVFSRTLSKAEELAKKTEAEAIDDLSKIISSAELYIIAVHDDAIKTVSDQLNIKGLVTHTSGSVSTKVLDKHKRYGSFYPLQTFRKEKKSDWKKIPFCLDANKKKDLDFLEKVARSINDNVYFINSENRKKLHLSAVIVNNFVNHLIGVAKNLCDENDVPFEVLIPLLNETVKKATKNNPFDVQTGPAIREDKDTIKNHLQLLDEQLYRDLYKMISRSIAQTNFGRETKI